MKIITTIAILLLLVSCTKDKDKSTVTFKSNGIYQIEIGSSTSDQYIIEANSNGNIDFDFVIDSRRTTANYIKYFTKGKYSYTVTVNGDLVDSNKGSTDQELGSTIRL